jgi:hypothetical protein
MKKGYKAGDDCPQCKKGMLRDSGRSKHGDRVLSCTTCRWEVRENT